MRKAVNGTVSRSESHILRRRLTWLRRRSGKAKSVEEWLKEPGMFALEKRSLRGGMVNVFKHLKSNSNAWWLVQISILSIYLAVKEMVQTDHFSRWQD